MVDELVDEGGVDRLAGQEDAGVDQRGAHADEQWRDGRGVGELAARLGALEHGSNPLALGETITPDLVERVIDQIIVPAATGRPFTPQEQP